MTNDSLCLYFWNFSLLYILPLQYPYILPTSVTTTNKAIPPKFPSLAQSFPNHQTLVLI